MVQAISDSGRRLSLLISENQKKTLQELLAEMNMTRRRKVALAVVAAVAIITCYFLLSRVWSQLSWFKEGLTGHLDQMSAEQNSQMSGIASRINSLENIVTGLDRANIADKLDLVVEKLTKGEEGNR